MPSASTTPTSIADLHTLTLVDGLPAQVENRPIRYRVVRLRETSVADERIAERQAERVMMVSGRPTLLVSDSSFRFALTARHIESFECDGQRITQATLGPDGWLDIVGKLSTHDLGLIEYRVYLLTLAAEVRYGTLSDADFAAIVAGERDQEGPQSPQPARQAAELGQAPAEPGDGPALLADFTRRDADGAAAGDGR